MLYQNGIRRGWLYPVDFDEEEWDSVLTYMYYAYHIYNISHHPYICDFPLSVKTSQMNIFLDRIS